MKPFDDPLGDRMKLLENLEAGRRLMPRLPVLARVDGRAFHSFTRGLERPYDQRFIDAMVATAKYLAEETNACLAYTQSDEITLAWHATDPKSQIWFDGRVHKMVSQLSAQATIAFDRALLSADLAEYRAKWPTFDARVWAVPNRAEGANAFLWREQDATKNSISMAASAHYSDKELHGVDSAGKQELLFKRGVNWNDYPAQFKRGTYVQRRTVVRRFTVTEIDKLPPKHQARTNPDLTVTRSEFAVLDMPIFSTVSNREDVVFNGDAPYTTADALRAPFAGHELPAAK